MPRRPASLQQEGAGSDAMVKAVLGGMNLRHLLSSPRCRRMATACLSHIYASGNIAADMLANITAEASGRMLATRLYNMTPA